MFFPSLEQVKEICSNNEYGAVPVRMEIYSGNITPVQVIKNLKRISKHCFMLESAEDAKNWGRYTFIGFDPSLELTCHNNKLRIKSSITINEEVKHPNEYIRKILKENKSPKFENMPTFTGGLVGYFSYDYIKYSEPTLNLNAVDEEGFKDVDLMLFNKLIAFDNFLNRIIIIVNIKTDDVETNYYKAITEIKSIKDIILNGVPQANKPLKLKSDFKWLFSKEQYCEMVEKAKKHIFEGDIFQVVLSNRLEAEIEGSLLDTYNILRQTNPSPYMFYFSSNDIEIAGASPETLVKLENNKIYTFPLAGTRPRGEDEESDKALEADLLSDEKELAEHNMLVDLGRNDIGKISKLGTVRVEKYMSIERFSHVMHIGSTVSGEIREDKDSLDAIDAILPAGTLSGAPKLKACEIINNLENNKRGIYGGAIGYLDFSGNLDTCIAIRLAFSKNGKVFVRAGAGIVADSVPENEYQECINKAKAVVNALKIADGGIKNDTLDR